GGGEDRRLPARAHHGPGAADQDRAADGHRPVPLPRAGDGQAGPLALGHLRARHRGLRDAERAPSLHRLEPGGDRDGAGQAAAAGAPGGDQRGPAPTGDDDARQGAREPAALRLRRLADPRGDPARCRAALQHPVRPGAGSGGTGGSSSGRGPGASPTGTRTAAMPLPLSGRGRGIRHRSGASGPSALSAASAGSAPRRSSRSARSANSARSAGSALSAGSAASPSPAPRSAPDGQRTPTSAGPAERGGPAAYDGVDTPNSSRTVRGTSTTGRKFAGLS